jgi:hypothetical protein
VPMSFRGRRTVYARRRPSLGNSYHTHDTAPFSSANFQQQHCKQGPSTDIRSLIYMHFLVHYAISTFQIHRTRHLSETELDSISPHPIHSMPFDFRFRLYLFPSLFISFIQLRIGFNCLVDPSVSLIKHSYLCNIVTLTFRSIYIANLMFA